MARVFIYGTLLNRDLLRIVLGREFKAQDACLSGFRSSWVKGQEFPMLAADPNYTADGIVLENVSPEEIARLDFYEGPYSYDLAEVEIDVDGEKKRAQTYLPEAGKWTPDRAWSIDEWNDAHGDLTIVAAHEIMARFGSLSMHEVANRMPVILARAQARLNAMANPSPRRLRANMDANDIEIRASNVDHDNFFLTEEQVLQHPKYDGSRTDDIRRAVFVMADAVTVLPYDPVRDAVMLIEQFRAGIRRRGDPHPWSLEVIAGRIDAGETAEEAARREVLEETGLRISSLELVSRYYSSPGATTEYLTSYVAIADLPDSKSGLGGLASEGEDIRSMVVPFEDLMAAIDSGEAENAPLLVSALSLLRIRERLRTSG